MGIFRFFLHTYKVKKMKKEINFEIEVKSQEDFEKVHELLRVHVANLELTGSLKIVDLGVKKKSE